MATIDVLLSYVRDVDAASASASTCRAPPHRACRQSARRAYSGAIPALCHAVRGCSRSGIARLVFIMGPQNEKVRAAEITKWCKAHPTGDHTPTLK